MCTCVLLGASEAGGALAGGDLTPELAEGGGGGGVGLVGAGDWWPDRD